MYWLLPKKKSWINEKKSSIKYVLVKRTHISPITDESKSKTKIVGDNEIYSLYAKGCTQGLQIKNKYFNFLTS